MSTTRINRSTTNVISQKDLNDLIVDFWWAFEETNTPMDPQMVFTYIFDDVHRSSDRRINHLWNFMKTTKLSEIEFPKHSKPRLDKNDQVISEFAIRNKRTKQVIYCSDRDCDNSELRSHFLRSHLMACRSINPSMTMYDAVITHFPMQSRFNKGVEAAILNYDKVREMRRDRIPQNIIQSFFTNMFWLAKVINQDDTGKIKESPIKPDARLSKALYELTVKNNGNVSIVDVIMLRYQFAPKQRSALLGELKQALYNRNLKLTQEDCDRILADKLLKDRKPIPDTLDIASDVEFIKSKLNQIQDDQLDRVIRKINSLKTECENYKGKLKEEMSVIIARTKPNQVFSEQDQARLDSFLSSTNHDQRSSYLRGLYEADKKFQNLVDQYHVVQNAASHLNSTTSKNLAVSSIGVFKSTLAQNRGVFTRANERGASAFLKKIIYILSGRKKFKSVWESNATLFNKNIQSVEQGKNRVKDYHEAPKVTKRGTWQ